MQRPKAESKMGLRIQVYVSKQKMKAEQTKDES